MPIMIETKDKHGYTCLIIGNILSSSTSESIQLNYQKNQQLPSPPPFSPATIPTITASTSATSSKSRDDQCIMCSNLIGFRFLLNEIETRSQQQTVDIHLLPSQLLQSITFEKNEQLKDFFSQCLSRVDIILSPSHDGNWYPYWETSENNEEIINSKGGMRKLAPQFRSNGIGYLRLGNDMSNFGTDFLSSDGMINFLSNYHLALDEKMTGVENNQQHQESLDNNLLYLINQLSDSSSKWNERCNYLKKIHNWLK